MPLEQIEKGIPAANSADQPQKITALNFLDFADHHLSRPKNDKSSSSKQLASIFHTPVTGASGHFATRQNGLKINHAFDNISADPDRVSKISQSLAGKLDRDGNEYISAKELNAVMKDNSLSNEQAAFVATLKESYSIIKDFSNDEWGTESEISRKDMSAMMAKWRAPVVKGTEIDKIRLALFFDLHGLINSPEALYGTPNPLDSVKPEMINQPPTVGICHLVAGIQSMAAVDPEKITEMITDNKNGTYTVQFPGLDSVTVNEPTKAERAYYSLTGSGGIWPSVLMKAYGKYWDASAAQDIEGGDGGSAHSDGQRKITGKGIHLQEMGRTDCATIAKKLTEAFSRRIITTASIDGNWAQDERENYSNLYRSHTYGVIGFEPSLSGRAEDAQIIVINPHLTNEWVNDTPPPGIEDLKTGKIKMSLAVFKKVFSSLDYSE